MPHLTVNCPLSWNSDEQKTRSSLSKNTSLKVGSPPQFYHDIKHLGIQLPDEELSTIQLTGPSHHKLGAMGGTNSQDQCISSESDQDEGSVKGVEGQMKQVFFLNNQDMMYNPSQVGHSHAMARVPYPYVEPCFGGLFTPYGPQAIIQPQMVGIAPARVPLPLDLADDGPIYVNPKQYHGILRRRQSRAKLEAQNKLVKTRKPYLHESRHRHAINRVRGSGGRFVSTGKLKNPDRSSTSSTHCVADSNAFHPSKSISECDNHEFETGQQVASLTTCSDTTTTTRVSDGNGDTIFQQPGRRFSCIAPHMGGAMQCNGCLVSGGARHPASVVR
ncbi:LOW QUALITY PROTEIN: nuclear transcription factor Y subunit A-3-like [Alnus glutinosa]|uniref:LOW QUALITY PROTEIN: nuclear transcription factor Y subunit A-3-like n=1 Tax=Alnus glutinosa TaxID=3517 RepID=UPI002D7698AF|nr:LOW QUALITY PROTEIN: nuclear transcription factor Y subunit A-3-like [Alnus glutinosa]